MTAAPPRADASDPVAEAQKLIQAGRVDQALAALDAVLAEDGDNGDALYTKAVCHRMQSDTRRARDALRRLKTVRPDSGRAWQEEGHLNRDIGQWDAALTAYQRATAHNPALLSSWNEQIRLLEARGEAENARIAAMQRDRMAALPKPLQTVTSFLHEGKLYKAEQLCRSFLKRNKTHVEGMRLLAELGSRLNVMEDAEFLLSTALELEPDNVAVRIDYMRLLRKRQRYADALAQAKILYDRDPENPVFLSNYAVESQMAGETDKALGLFDRVLEKLPDDPVTLLSRGHALKTIGETDKAVESYRASYQARPDYGDAYWSLANLKTYRFSDDEIDTMRAQEARDDLTVTDRVHLCFALGKGLEDRGDHADAFAYYERGNRLKRDQSRYRADQMDEELAAQKAICTPDLFEAKAGMGAEDPDPIFIVGLPRAGSTLLEQILASHSQVDGTMELPNILALSHKLRGRERITQTSPYPRVLHDLSADQIRDLGERYIEDTRIHRGEAPFFTDKMPNNFRHLGFLHLILPNAKIIDARRHPMDCCFSGFKQLFAEGQEFTYGLEEIGRYYRGYVDLMQHWDQVMPGRILKVIHEDVVDDLEGQVRRILDFCGLPFEQACVDFHKTRRAVRTASSEQVRQPINRGGMEQWRPFEPWLDPLKQALGPALDGWRA
ncbi:sulfotransferase [Yunchengibacter salinarum]